MDARYEEVPIELQAPLTTVLPDLRAAMRVDHPEIKDEDLALEGGDRLPGVGGVIAGAALFLAGTVSEGLTKKYVDEILWPRLKPSLEAVTDKVQQKLKDFLDSIARDP